MGVVTGCGCKEVHVYIPFHIRSCHALLLFVPHVRTGYCYFSFVHSSCKLWNTLPLIVLQSCIY